MDSEFTSSLSPHCDTPACQARAFSASTGAVVQRLSPHHQEQVPEHTNLTPAMKADVYSLIARIDPAYSRR
jgi:hypothetical protein